MTDFPQNPHGSRQLRDYRRARRDGHGLSESAEIAGISVTEARLIDADDAKNPPPAEAFEDPAPLCHNSGEPAVSDSATDDRLRLHIERAERLLAEKKGISDDIRDVFAEAKSDGYDPPIMREMIKRRAMDRQKLAEREALIEAYSVQLGLEF